jgi:hypothetical protein
VDISKYQWALLKETYKTGTVIENWTHTAISPIMGQKYKKSKLMLFNTKEVSLIRTISLINSVMLIYNCWYRES